MVSLVLAATLLFQQDRFGSPATPAWCRIVAERVNRACSTGAGSEVLEPWRQDDQFAIREHEGSFMVSGANGVVIVRASDGRALSASARSFAVPASFSDLVVLDKERIEDVLGGVLTTGGWPFESRLVDIRRSRPDSGEATLSVTFVPVYRNVPFSRGSIGTAELHPASGRLRSVYFPIVCRPPESLAVGLDPDAARRIMVAELLRRGLEAFSFSHEPALAIVPSTLEGVPSDPVEYTQLAWERQPVGCVVYEAVARSEASPGLQFWMSVRADDGSLLRVTEVKTSP